MKLAKLVSLLVVGTALSFGFTGCRKGPDKMTNIPGQRTPQPGDTRAEPIGAGNPIDTGNTGAGDKGVTAFDPTKGSGIAASSRNFDDMSQNREVFQNEIVYFDFDQSVIKSSETSKLDDIARRMKTEFQGKFLRIEGYCDERGTEEYNRALGDRRALSAREYLAKLGINPEDIQTISFGKDKPADPGHTAAAWTKNRRCEFVLLTPK
jgi:peptidoglycan-associated lipoprotein